MGQKSSDFSAIPLCGSHHIKGSDSFHALGQWKFSQHHHLNIPALIRRLHAKPRIRIEAAQYVAYFESEAFLLGPTNAGLKLAIEKWRTLRKERLAAERSRRLTVC